MIVERQFDPRSAATPEEAEHLARVSMGTDLVLFMNVLEEAFKAEKKSGGRYKVAEKGSPLNEAVQEAARSLGLVGDGFQIRFKPQEPLGRGKPAAAK